MRVDVILGDDFMSHVQQEEESALMRSPFCEQIFGFCSCLRILKTDKKTKNL